VKSKRSIVLAILLTVFILGQIALTVLLYNKDGISILRNIGWVILWISAIFGWLPIFTLKKWGGVQKGKSYVKTTRLVDRGIYSIVRHPQYLAGMLICIALALIAQNWIAAIPGIFAVLINYHDTFEEEKEVLEKFGEPYRRYKESVPRINFVAGIIRLLRKN